MAKSNTELMNRIENIQQVPTKQIDFKSTEMINTLKNTVASGLNEYEFLMFVEHCKATGLNPFKKEVWAIKTKPYKNKNGETVEGKVQIMTGIGGFHRIANDKAEYDGFETGLIDINGGFVPQSYPKLDFIGGWCRVYRKDRRIPIEGVAMLEEYDKSKTENYYPDKGIWRIMKRAMIQKCAESIALRKAFPQELNGLYTQEEMSEEFNQKNQVAINNFEIKSDVFDVAEESRKIEVFNNKENKYLIPEGLPHAGKDIRQASLEGLKKFAENPKINSQEKYNDFIQTVVEEILMREEALHAEHNH